MTEPEVENTLRFGVMCSGHSLARWQAEALEHLLAMENVELGLVIRDPRRSGAPPPEALLDRVRRHATGGTFLWNAYNNIYVARRAKSLARVDCSQHLAAAPTIDAAPTRRGKFSEVFTDEDVRSVRSHDLDFVLRFGYGIIRGEILDAARLGVWSFHHGDEQSFRGSPPAFWEVMHRSRVTGVLLQRLTDRLDGGIVLRKGWFRTAQHSYVANTDRVHFGGTNFPAEVCSDVLRDDYAYLSADPSTTDAPIYLKPSNREVLRFARKIGASFIHNQAVGLIRSDQWNVGRVHAPINRLLDDDFTPDVEWFHDRRGRNHFLADPFPVLSDPTANTVLAEDYSYRTRQGRISLLDFQTGTRRDLGIDDGAHQSYPFTFCTEGREFLVVQITGRSSSPSWELSGGTLSREIDMGIDMEMLDPTVTFHDGRWWLFFTKPGGHSLTRLYVYWADSPFGPWSPHLRNPVKTDIRSARPAGTPFHHGEDLYRPAQDCSTSYGGGISICRVDELTRESFEETVVRTVHASADWPYSAGIHTISAHGDVTFIDARRSRFNPYETRAELAARFRRLTQAVRS